MDRYVPPYNSIVPRLLPSQTLNKKLPLNEDMYGYHSQENGQLPMKIGPPSINQNMNRSSFTTRSQLMNPDASQSDFDNPIKGKKNKTRLHLETLKDDSTEMYPNNNAIENTYPINHPDYRSPENSPKKNSTQSIKTLIIIFGLIIGLFSLTALGISIYLLIRMSTSSG